MALFWGEVGYWPLACIKVKAYNSAGIRWDQKWQLLSIQSKYAWAACQGSICILLHLCEIIGFVSATQQGSACSKQTANSRRQFKFKTLCPLRLGPTSFGPNFLLYGHIKAVEKIPVMVNFWGSKPTFLKLSSFPVQLTAVSDPSTCQGSSGIGPN